MQIPLVFAAALVFALFIPLRVRRARVLRSTPLDRLIPFAPAFAYAYLGFLILLPFAAIALAQTPEWRAFLLALILAELVYALLHALVSWGAPHAAPQGKSLARRLVREAYALDQPAPRRTFPSAHAYLSVIVAFYLGLAFPAYAAVFYLAALLVCLSTVCIKQHNVIDLAGGIALATAAIALAGAMG